MSASFPLISLLFVYIEIAIKIRSELNDSFILFVIRGGFTLIQMKLNENQNDSKYSRRWNARCVLHCWHDQSNPLHICILKLKRCLHCAYIQNSNVARGRAQTWRLNQFFFSHFIRISFIWKPRSAEALEAQRNSRDNNWINGKVWVLNAIVARSGC